MYDASYIQWYCEYCADLGGFLYKDPSSPLVCPANPHHLNFLNSSLCLINSQDHQSLFSFLICTTQIRITSWHKPGAYGAHLICFPSFKDHNPVLSVVSCLKAVVSYVLSSVLGKSVFVTPSWLEETYKEILRVKKCSTINSSCIRMSKNEDLDHFRLILG